jgi:hypothetical protein
MPESGRIYLRALELRGKSSETRKSYKPRGLRGRSLLFMIRIIGLRPKGPPFFSPGQRPGAKELKTFMRPEGPR